jgi:hypothetical protein
MAKLKAVLMAGDYELLDDSLKTFYVQSGDNWTLDADGIEDVSGLKAKNAELLAELKKRGDLVKQFDGLDAETARKALDEMAKLEEKKLLDRQKFDELLAKREDEFKKREQDLQTRYQQVFESSAETDLRMKLVANGVRDELAEEFAIILKAKHIKPVEESGKTVWRSLANDAETIDLDKFIPSLKGNGKAVFFKASDASGSGASGSGKETGGGVTMTGTAFESLSESQQRDFSLKGGKII